MEPLWSPYGALTEPYSSLMEPHGALMEPDGALMEPYGALWSLMEPLRSQDPWVPNWKRKIKEKQRETLEKQRKHNFETTTKMP